jgi:hypothetical protein
MSKPTPWITATASSGGSQCVEMRRDGEAIEVRNSKDPHGPVLTFSAGELAAWLDGAKKGEFDHLSQ